MQDDSDYSPLQDEAFVAFLNGLPENHQDALERLTPIIYNELRKIAHQRLRFERDNHTLNTTALVHEVYISLSQYDVQWQSRGHFLATASKIMRQLLINYARKRNTQKRGGDAVTVSLDAVPEVISHERAQLLIDLDEALKKLSAFDERGAQIIEYRFFGGLSQPEIAKIMGVSERTVRRLWVMAKTWIQKELQNDQMLGEP